VPKILAASKNAIVIILVLGLSPLCYGQSSGLYWAIGDYAKAESLYKEDLQIRQKLSGREHPDTASQPLVSKIAPVGQVSLLFKPNDCPSRSFS
jgi:hypothetical protein